MPCKLLFLLFTFTFYFLLFNFPPISLTKQIATQLRNVYFGGNWTAVNLKENLADITWQQATAKVHSFNTIASLVFHMNYYVNTVGKLIRGQQVDSSDKYSFNHPPVACPEDWNTLLDKTWAEVENFAVLVEKMPENKLWETCLDDQYGNFYRNIHGVIEHAHYHLGQIVLIRKILLQA